jgi:long-chain fatty acid transport protein
MGNAVSALGDDPSTVFFNPAGLTSLSGTRLALGAAPLFPVSDYDDGAGASSKMSDFIPVVPHLYMTRGGGDGKWAVGLGVFSPYGLKAVWPSDGPFRYVTTESDLSIPEFSPAAAFAVNETLSVGLGLVYARANVEIKKATPNDPGDPDGEQILEGEGDGIGVNAGVLYRPTPSHSFALTYRSDIKIDLDGTLKMKGLTGTAAGFLGGPEFTTDVRTALTLPPSVTAGYGFRRGKWTVGADAEWVGFSSYRSTDLDFPDTFPFGDQVTRQEYKDKWSVGTGVNYAWNGRWETRAGYSFLPAVVPEATWDPSVPDSDIHGLHAGGTFTFGGFGLDLAYTYYRFASITVNNDVGADVGAPEGADVDGTYKTAAQIVSVNVSWKW